VTDREVIDNQCREIAQDLSAGKFDAAERYLDDDFASSLWLTKSIAIETGAAAIAQLDVGNVSLEHLQTKVDHKHAVTTVRTMINVRSVGREWPMDWKLTWVKKSQGWRIVEAGYTQHQLGGQ
jgi:hypothetical protein